jgi:hypothetical protein
VHCCGLDKLTLYWNLLGSLSIVEFYWSSTGVLLEFYWCLLEFYRSSMLRLIPSSSSSFLATATQFGGFWHGARQLDVLRVATRHAESGSQWDESSGWQGLVATLTCRRQAFPASVPSRAKRVNNFQQEDLREVTSMFLPGTIREYLESNCLWSRQWVSNGASCSY